MMQINDIFIGSTNSTNLTDMKPNKLFAGILAGFVILISIPIMAQESPAEPYLGLWALSLDYESSNAGWLEVRQEDGYLDAEILWRWGSVFPVDFTMIFDGQLLLVHGQEVVRERDDSGNPVRVQNQIFWFDVKKEGNDEISGAGVFPNRDGIEVESEAFTGKRIPPYGKAPETNKIKYGDPIKLFNGDNLEGWELLEQNAANGWKVVDGVLINDPVQKKGEEPIHYGNLRTKDVFEDFHLEVEVNVPEGSNSGVYLRGIYEVQVMDSYGKALDPHNMGALYSRITPSESAEKPAGEWQELEMTLYKRHLTVSLNGKAIIDNQPVKGITGGALWSDEFSPGPIYLQGDHGKVSYRKVVLTPILD
jgi:hypothetical protein